MRQNLVVGDKQAILVQRVGIRLLGKRKYDQRGYGHFHFVLFIPKGHDTLMSSTVRLLDTLRDAINCEGFVCKRRGEQPTTKLHKLSAPNCCDAAVVRVRSEMIPRTQDRRN